MVSVLVLVRDEMIHLPRLIGNLSKISDDICVVDSFSSDGSFEFLGKTKGVKVVQNKWVDYSNQFNFGLSYFQFRYDWIMRMDADEYLSESLVKFIREELNNLDVTGVSLNRGVFYKGKILRWGGYRKVKLLRLWRKGLGHIERRKMDEHIVVQGSMIHKNLYLYDYNLNNIDWWTEKHVSYARREMEDYFSRETLRVEDLGIANRIRFWKNIYNRMPLFYRAYLYAFYRLILRGGILDGRGVVFHLYQCLWYRMLVDTMISEQKNKDETKQV